MAITNSYYTLHERQTTGRLAAADVRSDQVLEPRASQAMN